MHHILFEGSVKCGGTTEVAVAGQVAFLIADCTHYTYYRALKLALRIDAVSPGAFMSTIIKMCPVVNRWLTRCVSRQRATWRAWIRLSLVPGPEQWRPLMARWWHVDITKKMPRKTIFTRALLYYKHLCQRDRDKLIKEALYQKAADAHLTLKRANQEGMHIEVHWQDANSVMLRWWYVEATLVELTRSSLRTSQKWSIFLKTFR